MAQQIKKTVISMNEASKLTSKLVRKGLPNYLIRDALIERGFSAFRANQIIADVRREYSSDTFQDSNKNIVRFVLVLMGIAILILALLIVSVPVS